MMHRLDPVIPAAPFRIERNRGVDRAPNAVPEEGVATLWRQFHDDALHVVQGLPGYSATPLRELREMASAAQLGAIYYKDESNRFGLGSFKGLGGIYAVIRATCGDGGAGVIDPSTGATSIAAGRAGAARLTVVCATDGNHGRAVAMGAKLVGCRCIVYLPSQVSAARERAIVTLGANTIRIEGNYDDAVRAADAEASRHGWIVVPDTADDAAALVPRDVMCGYMTLMWEIIDVLGTGPDTLSHVFVQAGVGGLAASVSAYCRQLWGAERPTLVVVESDRADCLLRSSLCGRPTTVAGDHDTIMAGLACGEPSAPAWPILERGVDFFMAIPDEAALATMRLLAAGFRGADPIVSGESGAVGLAALLLSVGNERARAELDLNASSRVLVIGTEGATDPELYARLIGAHQSA